MATEPVLSITGTVSFRERIAVPPGAVATVKLVDTDGEVLAASATEVQGVPAEFVLHVDPGLVADLGKLLLWAALRTESGVWGTTELVPVPNPSDSTSVMLTKIDD
jgi:putative lipoprotein